MLAAQIGGDLAIENHQGARFTLVAAMPTRAAPGIPS